MGRMQTVTMRNGQNIEVDIDACGEFDYQHGDKVEIVRLGQEATVIGVAPMPEGIPGGCTEKGAKLLWVRRDGEQCVVFFPNPQDDFLKI